MNNKPYPLYKVHHISTLKELIEFCEKEYKNKKAFWFADRKKNITEKSFIDVADTVKRLASFIRDNFDKGTHIAIFGENSYNWIIAYLAITSSGCVAVPIDKELSPKDAEELVVRSKSKMLFYSKTYSDEVSEMELKEVKSVCFDEFDTLSGEFLYENCEVLPEDLAVIVYTSGTTGKSKGVMLTHKNLATNAYVSPENLGVPCGTILLLPLHHTFGMMAGVLVQMLLGFPVFINSSLRYIARDIELAKPKHLSVVPLIIDALYKKVWEAAEKQGKAKALKTLIKFSNGMLKCGIDLRGKLFKGVRDGLGGIEMLISGGAAIDPALISGMEAFGIKMINGYGITECSPIVATTRNKHNNFPSVGCVVPKCEVKIVNKDADGFGEIYIRGDIVTSGYYDDEEANKNSFEDGWFKTGDIGYFDKDGFLYVNGRKKNLIILANGKNVSPEELEFDIQNIENVLEVIVYEKDKLITAEIFAEDKTGIEDGIAELNKSLPSYKQIQKVIFRDTEFEKTSTKKIKR